jgi:hypothetical protein
MNKPTGMKYMFATLCSNPAATKAEMGGMIARIFPAVVRAEKVIQTARQTRMLHMIPNPSADQNSRPLLKFATVSAVFQSRRQQMCIALT